MIPTTLRPRIDRAIVPLVGVVATVGALVLLGAVVVTAAAAPAAPATQDDRPTVAVATTSVASGETETVAVRLSEAPEGLSGYNLELAVADPAVARIESASYPERFGLTTEPSIGPDGERVALEAADLDGAVEAGAANVTLARVNVTGVDPGAANLSVEPVQFDGDDGSRIEPVPDAGVVTVDATDDGTPGDGSASPADDSPGGSNPAVSPGEGSGTAAGGATTGTATTSGDGSIATLPVFVGVALLALGGVALRRRLA